ncbi:hypothetical protein INS49_010741 [Diaporthe citri]|uniref:uncharacterized protein n=1 Tax=Diaporthe citri TaxID=83186 RepID=UPI001C813CD9|nr:uncharacterized protein INS49_010741 [Diaporthe citri]KAG6362509.1 hypothetical protein INS49_010741 [Diaporthe citri]
MSCLVLGPYDDSCSLNAPACADAMNGSVDPRLIGAGGWIWTAHLDSRLTERYGYTVDGSSSAEGPGQSSQG